MSFRLIHVGRSATGLGLFATKAIARTDYIVTYRGRRIPTEEAHARETRSGAKYMFEINRKWTIDGSSRRNLARYTNHSCNPNAEAVLRKGQIMLVALQRIAAGEEITLDYGKDYFDLFIKDSGCRCAECLAKAAARRRRRTKRSQRSRRQSR
jgi:SET domain-containing protein